MQVRKGKPPGSGRLARTGWSLAGKRGSVALDFYHGCHNVARTCRHFGITVRRSSVGSAAMIHTT